MPIAAGDIQYRLSGGNANATPDASLGGIISATALVDASLHNLFDQVSGAETSAGASVEYRCIYVRNGHATLTLQGAALWIKTQAAPADQAIAIGLDPAGVGDGSSTGVATTAADEGTAPAGVSFSAPSSGAPLNIGSLAPGEAIGIWVRRTVDQGAAAANNVSAVLRVEGDTAA